MEDSRQDLRTEHSARRTRKSKCKMQISKCRMPRSGICHEIRSKEETIFAKTGTMWRCSTEARRRRRGKDGRWKNEDAGWRAEERNLNSSANLPIGA